MQRCPSERNVRSRLAMPRLRCGVCQGGRRSLVSSRGTAPTVCGIFCPKRRNSVAQAFWSAPRRMGAVRGVPSGTQQDGIWLGLVGWWCKPVRATGDGFGCGIAATGCAVLHGRLVPVLPGCQGLDAAVRVQVPGMRHRQAGRLCAAVEKPWQHGRAVLDRQGPSLERWL